MSNDESDLWTTGQLVGSNLSAGPTYGYTTHYPLGTRSQENISSSAEMSTTVDANYVNPTAPVILSLVRAAPLRESSPPYSLGPDRCHRVTSVTSLLRVTSGSMDGRIRKGTSKTTRESQKADHRRGDGALTMKGP